MTSWGAEIWGVLLILASLLVSQLYAVRELLAAELIFAVLFLAMAAFGIGMYLIGALGERGVDATRERFHAAARFLGEAYRNLEAATQRVFHRHHEPHAAK